MKDYRVKAVARGLAIIAFAICLLLGNTDAYSNFPMVKIGMCIILVLVMIESAFEKSFLGIFFPLGIIACLFQDEIGLGDVHYGIIILAFVLIGAGLTVIFDKKPKIVVNHDGKEYVVGNGKGKSEYWEDNGNFDLDNGLGARTQYVSIKNMRKGKIDNGLGQLTAYFDGSTVAPEGAELDIDNGLGKMSLYFPKDFRVSFDFDNGLGNINVHGECSQDENQPLVKAKVDNGLGQIDIYFN